MLRKLSPMLASAFATLLLAGVAVAAVGSNSSAGADASIATEASTTAATEGSTSTSDGSTATTDGSTSTTTGDDGTTSTTVDDDNDGTTATTVGDDDNDGTTVSTLHEDDDDDDDGPTPTTIRDDTDDDHQLIIEPGVYTFPLANGGSVSVTIEQQLIVDFVVDAGDGWSYTIEQHEGDRLRVELTNGETEIEIEIRTDGGLEVEIDD